MGSLFIFRMAQLHWHYEKGFDIQCIRILDRELWGLSNAKNCKYIVPAGQQNKFVTISQ